MCDRAPPAVPGQAPPRGGGGSSDAARDLQDDTSHERQSVSELVRNYSDPLEHHKRDRSESGDPAPPGKRGARELGGEPAKSPSTAGGRSFKERLDDAIDGLESRLMASFSRELHEFRESLTAEIAKLNERVRDLEQHTEEKDGIIDKLTNDLQQSRAEVAALQSRVEDAEMHSRVPCLILSGAVMAPRHAPRLEPPLPHQSAPAAADPTRSVASAVAGQGRLPVTSRSADRPGGPGQSGGRGGGVRDAARSGDREAREDMNALVIDTLNRCLPGLGINAGDIDRAHRLPGANNRVIVRFTRSGEGSIRDCVMSRRLELRGKDLYISESLTKLRSLIFRSLLAAKREQKLYTVYTRGGHVFVKKQQFGVSTRVDSLDRVRELGYGVLER